MSQSIRTIAFIQARLTSTRLPNKVLAKIGPWNSMEWMLRRLRRAKTLDKIVFLIPETKENDSLRDFLKQQLGVEVFRGSEKDVLGRFAKALIEYPADYYVRLTADCPLICPELVDEVVKYTQEHSLAYVSNTYPPTFPDGFDVECVSREALSWTAVNVQNSQWREHVTYGLRKSHNKPAAFGIGNVSQKGCDGGSIRLTLDNEEDLKMFSTLFALYGANLENMDHTELQAAYIGNRLDQINGNHERNIQLRAIIEKSDMASNGDDS